MNVFYSESDTSTARMIAPFAGGLLALLVAVAGLGWSDWIVLAAGLLAVVLLVWWVLNLISWARDGQLERRQRIAEMHPLVVQYNALTKLEEQRADLLRVAVGLDRAQIELIRELGAIPTATIRGGSAVLIHTTLELGGAVIPWAFCSEFMTLYHERGGQLPPVRHWSDSRNREYAKAILDWLHSEHLIIPAAGDNAAKWKPGLTERACAFALARSGVAWAALWWESYTDNAGDEA